MNVEALKVGDKVLIGVAVGDWVRKTSYKIPKPIERFTATQIIVDGRRFRKETLTEVGNSWAKLELDLSKSQLEEYNLHCKKLKMLHHKKLLNIRIGPWEKKFLLIPLQ